MRHHPYHHATAVSAAIHPAQFHWQANRQQLGAQFFRVTRSVPVCPPPIPMLTTNYFPLYCSKNVVLTPYLFLYPSTYMCVSCVSFIYSAQGHIIKKNIFLKKCSKHADKNTFSSNYKYTHYTCSNRLHILCLNYNMYLYNILCTYSKLQDMIFNAYRRRT